MNTLTLFFLICILSTAVITDIRHHRIPNWLVFPAMLIGVVYHTSLNGMSGLFFSVLGLGSGLLLLIFFYMIGGMGAGDVKLMGSVGSFIGPADTLTAFYFTAFTGGLFALMVIAKSGSMMSLVRRYGSMLKIFLVEHKLFYIPPTPSGKMPVLPYGVAIAIGTILTVAEKYYLKFDC